MASKTDVIPYPNTVERFQDYEVCAQADAVTGTIHNPPVVVVSPDHAGQGEVSFSVTVPDGVGGQFFLMWNNEDGPVLQ